MKLIDCDRCYSVQRIPLAGGNRELVLYNLHLSACGYCLHSARHIFPDCFRGAGAALLAAVHEEAVVVAVGPEANVVGRYPVQLPGGQFAAVRAVHRRLPCPVPPWSILRIARDLSAKS